MIIMSTLTKESNSNTLVIQFWCLYDYTDHLSTKNRSLICVMLFHSVPFIVDFRDTMCYYDYLDVVGMILDGRRPNVPRETFWVAIGGDGGVVFDSGIP